MRTKILHPCLVVLCCLLAWGYAYASEVATEVFKLNKIQENYDLSPYTQVLLDKEGTLNIEDFQNATHQIQFEPIDIEKPIYSSSEAYWVKIQLEHQLPDTLFNSDWLLALNPHNPHVEAYILQDDSLLSTLYAGQHLPFEQRSYHALMHMSRSCIPVHFPRGEKLDIYLKFIEKRDRPVNLQINLISPQYLDRKIIHSLLLSALMIGGLFLMIFFVLSVNRYAWCQEYIYYLGYLLSLLFVELFTTGFDTHYISGQFGLMSNWLEPTLWAANPGHRTLLDVRWFIIIMAYVVFIKSYLNLKELLPAWDKIMSFVLVSGGIMIPVTLFALVEYEYDLLLCTKIIAFYVAMYYVITIAFLFPLYRTGDDRAIFVIGAFSVIILGSIPTLCGSFNLGNSSGYDDLFLILALFVEKFIFILALNFRQRKTEKHLRQGEQEKNQMLERQNTQLAEANRRVVAAAKVKKDFLGLVSHELRTPMNGIMGFTELLKTYPSNEDQDFCIKNLDLSSKTMLRLINNLLNLLDTDEENVALERQAFNIHEFLDTLISAHQKANDNKQVGIYSNTNPKIPAMLMGDQKRLKLILDNLLDNAQKYTEKGAVFLNVHLLEPTNDKVKLGFNVEDTGIGIIKERQKFIFETFSQAKNSIDRNYDGLGIGLPLTKRLLALYGSEIRLSSTPGEGSSFEFDLEFEVAS